MSMMDEVQAIVEKKLPSWFIEEHVKAVVKWALKLCEHYPEADKEVVEVAAWLHDIGHTKFGKEYYHSEEHRLKKGHNIRGARVAREFLNSINFPKEKIDAVVHCIESHRTTTPPEPKTIEAKIVASADNLAHFSEFDTVVKSMGLELALKKTERDMKANFMLPEALDYAKKEISKIKKYFRKA